MKVQKKGQNKNHRKNRRKNTRRIRKLVEFWPELFSAKKPVPLAIDILSELSADATKRGLKISDNEIRIALISYTLSFRYLRTLVSGGFRYGISRTPRGVVSTAARRKAAIMLYHMRHNSRTLHEEEK